MFDELLEAFRNFFTFMSFSELLSTFMVFFETLPGNSIGTFLFYFFWDDSFWRQLSFLGEPSLWELFLERRRNSFWVRRRTLFGRGPFFWGRELYFIVDVRLQVSVSTWLLYRTPDPRLVVVCRSFVGGRLVELVEGHPRPFRVRAPCVP